jgi:hypothetical protein
MTEATAKLEQLLDIFARSGMELTAEEVADMLWLAARLPATDADVAPPPAARPGIPPSLPPALPRQSLSPERGEKFGQTMAATTSPGPSGPATTNLYPVQAGISAGGTGARTIRSPAAFALPGSLDLGRSLRPLKRRVPSRISMVLDETATAHRIADTGDWTPVFNPAPERWLDVLLLVDESSSMVIWQRTIAELEQLLERQGAFRNIELLGFRVSPGNTCVQIYTGIGPAADRGRIRRPAELIDPLGRRLIAVVSDCVSPIWHNGVMASLLSGWGQAGLITVIQVLPDHLWVRTGLRTYPAIYLRATAPGAPNSQFEFEWTTYRPKTPLPRGTAVPVVSLEAQSLDYWARSLAGNSNLWIPGVFAISAKPVQAPFAVRTAVTTTPDQLVSRFYGTASPTARRLASILAATPLTQPVMRLVQRALLPESRQVHLAEVWLSGLIDRPTEIDNKARADSMEYLFVHGVRELLLHNLRLSETIDVLNTVSGYIGERLGQPLDFAALVADPTTTGELQIAQGYQAFARVAASALRRFGGQYADLAQRLEVSVYGQSTLASGPAPQVKIGHEAERQAGYTRRSEEAIVVRALLVGISKFESDKLTRLAGPVNDVFLTREWLQSRCGVSSSNLVALLNHDATKNAIVSTWRRLAVETKEGDQLFFHFSGRDQQIASSDPNEPDGLDESLFVYDSIPGDRASLLTHQELALLVAEVEQRGGRAVLVLDSCHTASGWFARQAFQNTLVLAAAAEGELAYEVSLGGKYHGAVSYFLADSMKAYKPGMTWRDAYDIVLANVRATGNKQTPQLIGIDGTAVFETERKPVPPYLLVTGAGVHEIEINAPAALGLKPGARLAIYPPGSMLTEPPAGFARIRQSAETVVTAVLEAPATVPLASRVRVLDYGVPLPLLRAGLDDSLLNLVQPSLLVAVDNLGAKGVACNVFMADGAYVIEDRSGRIIWHEYSAPSESDEARGVGVMAVIEHLAAYLRTLWLENADASSELAGKVDLEVNGQAHGDVVSLAEAEQLTLTLRNRFAANLYISVWMLDERLSIQRIFPATTTCVLFGAGREVRLAIAVRPRSAGEHQRRVTFKVFASREPADLGLLTLLGLDQSIELADLAETPQQPAAVEPEPKSAPKKAARAGVVEAPKEATWVPGGPVAVIAKLWKPGDTLHIKFLSGDLGLQKKVREAALEWTKYANLQFEFIDKGEAELRIGFKKTEDSWSYIGTDCLLIPKNQPTINLGSLTATTPSREFRAVVIHEFGHALGLAASQQSPLAVIPWNKKATYEYYGKIGWDRETVNNNVFTKYSPDQVRYGPADPHSIMYHPIPKDTTDGKIEITRNEELSEGDKQFIAQIYPSGESR